MQKFKLLLSFFLFYLLSCVSYSQNTSLIDSLLKASVKGDEVSRISVLNQLSHEYLDHFPYKSLDYSNQAIAIARKYKRDEDLAEGYLSQGKAYAAISENGSAEKSFAMALEIFTLLDK